MQRPGYCFRSGGCLDIGSDYTFRLEASFRKGFWVPSEEMEEGVAETKKDDSSYFDGLIKGQSVYQREGVRPRLVDLDFTCGGFRDGMHIWYKYWQPPGGETADKRRIGYYKKSEGPSATKYIEEKVICNNGGNGSFDLPTI